MRSLGIRSVTISTISKSCEENGKTGESRASYLRTRARIFDSQG